MNSNFNLDRRLKRVTAKEHEFFAVCAPGTAELLRAELDNIGVHGTVLEPGGISFCGHFDLIYEANIRVATMVRLLLRLGEGAAKTFTMLHSQIQRIPWELWIQRGGTFRVVVSSKSSRLNMRQRIASTVAEAVGERLRKTETIATYDQEAELEVHVRLQNDRATVSINTSGTPLYKRGYKTESGKAPIRETLAAAVLLHLDPRKYDAVLDPFCGSGTLLLEAARMSANISPGHYREFAYRLLPAYNPRKEEAIRRVHSPKEFSFSEPNLIGYDLDPSAVKATRRNYLNTEITGPFTVEQSDFHAIHFAGIDRRYEKILVVSNPPYGRRVKAKAGGVDDLFHLVPKASGWTIAMVRPRGTTKDAPIAMRFKNGGIPAELEVYREW